MFSLLFSWQGYDSGQSCEKGDANSAARIVSKHFVADDGFNI